MMTVIIGCAGMAVDLGNWYLQAQRYQRAADAASLAAAPFLPGDVAGARAAATKSLQHNGIKTDNVSTTLRVKDNLNDAGRFDDHVYIAPKQSNPRVMEVEVGRVLNNIFISVLGLNEQEIVRASNATFQAPVEMGSPSPVLGSEPANDIQGNLSSAADAGFNAKYWLNLSGPTSSKATGDQFGSGFCEFGNSNCSNGINTDFAYGSKAQRSHRFMVHIPDGVTSAVTVQLFDGSFVNVGDNCTDTDLLDAAAQATGDTKRYAAGNGEFCTGDVYNGGENAPAPSITAITSIAGPKETVGKALNTVVFPSAKTTAEVTAGMNSTGTPNKPSLGQTFRKWAPIATLSGSGDYVIEVKTTNADAAAANRFSLRAGVLSGNTFNSSLSKGVSISALGHFTPYTNATASDARFYFAKLTSNVAGRTIEVNLFDIGDASQGDGVDVEVVAPAGATGLANGTFAGRCSQLGPEDGRVTDISGDCKIPNATRDRFNGRTASMQIQIPANYTCTDNGGSECWMAIRFTVRNAQNVSSTNPSQDTTTWSITSCGRPLALVPTDESKAAEQSCKG